MRVVHSPLHRRHHPTREIVLGREVPAFEIPDRAEAILAATSEAGHEISEAGDPGDEILEAVHKPGYLRHLFSAWTRWLDEGGEGPLAADTFPLPGMSMSSGGPSSAEAAAGWFCFDASTPILEGTAEAARAAAGCAAGAAQTVLAGERFSYALCRPPGHHAGPTFSGGYCYVNNAAVAATLLASRMGRVAVLDLDYHHGNGTQRIFWENPEVFFASLHADPDLEYPYYSGRAEETGGPGAEGTTLNVPLPFGTDDDGYLAALESVLDRVATWSPGGLVASLGLDAFQGDPMGRFRLSAEIFERIGSRVGQLGVSTVVVQEGGYAVEALGDLVVLFLRGIEG